jgi:hypothetical protein
MVVLGENRDARDCPPRLHLPVGISFYDSFSAQRSYSLLHPGVEDGLVEGKSHRIPRKPVGSTSNEALLQLQSSPEASSASSPETPSTSQDRARAKVKTYRIIPAATALFFVAGTGIAIGHHVYLQSLDGTVVDNQVWIGRYSLAMAFLVKAFLGAVISLAFTQRLWYSLQRMKNGLSIFAIDALFAADQSPLTLFSWEMWQNASLPAVMAAFIWLIPLIQVVAPTALTTGSSHHISTNSHCSVPTLDMMDLPDISPSSLSLFDVDYEGVRFQPSTTARYLVDLTAQSGQQLRWSSPCGANCTYEIHFEAPAWKCNRTSMMDGPEASWLLPWFSGYGDGANYTVRDAEEYLEYEPIYQATYNSTTTIFWVGATDSVSFDSTSGDMSVKEFLDLHLYTCSIATTTYHLRVTYTDHQQVNEILALRYIGNINIPKQLWDGVLTGGKENATILGVVSIYSPLVDLLQGDITRSPQETMAANTNIGSIPALVHVYNGSMAAGQEDPYLPNLEIGPLLESLSHNLSISLLSYPNLDTTIQIETTCTTTTTLTVWKFHPPPLVTAYGCAVAAAGISLLLGAHAVMAAGMARDRSFSSIVRSTRHRDLDVLCNGDDESAALPLAAELRKQRFRFSTAGTVAATGCETGEKRLSFRTVDDRRLGGVVDVEARDGGRGT